MPTIETDLYPPIKAFLEGQGYAVKGEIGRCDVVAVRGDEDPVVVEMKTRFSLELLFQAVERFSLTDKVYVAIEYRPKSLFARRSRDVLRLCRRLGVGLLTVHVERGLVEPRLDPGPHQPRVVKKKRERLLREFARRVGDPTAGGSTKMPVMTAYRQDALRCARVLGEGGPKKVGELRAAAGVERAGPILLRDVYGWFERVERGVYGLTPVGERALEQFEEALDAL
ncbi:MAG: DUF2161 family putative PD-(D/E)XK-type phosphodiesterase [Alphaproteobacteria bacterium]|nr:DUF2161 family putative PD-(D/E)XK-type phosphodiesterase [Alphaproteobacteria bacterium]